MTDSYIENLTMRLLTLINEDHRKDYGEDASPHYTIGYLKGVIRSIAESTPDAQLALERQVKILETNCRGWSAE